MALANLLTEFTFDLETIDLLTSLGRTSEQVLQEMSTLSFNTDVLTFIQSERRRLNSILLRLRLYSEQNLDESSVRAKLNILNNSQVTALLNYLYSQYSTTQQTTSTSENTTDTKLIEEQEDEPNFFDSFFQECVEQTNEATDIVKSSEFYNSFTNWWTNLYDKEVPDKKELKSYLNEKLGKSSKNTWNKVCLTV